MEVIQSLAGTCRVAAAHDQVLNAECCYTFHTPYTTEGGILVSLNTFMGTVQEMAALPSDSPGGEEAVFVRIAKRRVEKPPPPEGEEPAVPTKLGIGVEGGFLGENDKYETITTTSIVVLRRNDADPFAPEVVVELPYSDDNKSTFPMNVADSVDSILCHAGLTTQQDVKAWQLDMDEDIPVSKYAAALAFVDNGVVIDPDPASWKCQKDGSTENLWLNLSDGYIGGGRRNWDGSGGSNGALDHYNETGQRYPLVVKLGTITADVSTADCYSYAGDEDGPVKIPNLAELLDRRGIKVASMYVVLCSRHFCCCAGHLHLTVVVFALFPFPCAGRSSSSRRLS
jgi:ubiquitin carboxyl-terminal hydrolase 5/13